MFRVTAAIGSLLFVTTLAAEPARMSGQAIRAAVVGSTIEIDTPLGTKLPLRFAEGGQVSGEAGGLSFYLGSATDTGRWWIANDRLCQRWSKWFDGEVQCLELRQDGERYLWRRDDGKTGTATITTKTVTAMAAASATTERSAIIAPMPRSTSKAPSLRVAGAPVQSENDSGNQVAPAAARTARPIEPVPERSAAAADAAAPAHHPLPAPDRLLPPATKSTRPETAAVAKPPAATPTFRVAGVAEFDVLYVRGGPSPDHAAVGWIPPYGRGVRVVGLCRQEWCPIQHRDLDGWVNRYYLVQEFPSQGAQRLAPTPVSMQATP